MHQSHLMTSLVVCACAYIFLISSLFLFSLCIALFVLLPCMHYAFNTKICLHSYSVYHVCAVCIVVVVIVVAVAAAAAIVAIVVVVIAVTTCYVVKYFFGYLACVT